VTRRRVDGRSHATWACLSTLVCSLGLSGCPTDDRPLAGLKGLVFITGGGTLGGEGGADAGQSGDGGQGDQSGGGDGAFGGSGSAGTSGVGATAGAGATSGVGATSGIGGTGGMAGVGNTAGSGGAVQAGTGGGGGHASGAGGIAGTGTGGMCPSDLQNADAGENGGGCPDLDRDCVSDCEETLVENASFNRDTTGWFPDDNLNVGWSTNDTIGHPSSGVLGAENLFTADQEGSLMLGASQCVSIIGGLNYVFLAQVSVPSDAGDTDAGFQLLFYDTAQCTGERIDVTVSTLVNKSVWQVVSLAYRAPLAAKSVAMRLVVRKPYRQAPAAVLFDNVLVRPE